MTGTGARTYEHLSSWDQTSNNDLFQVDLKDQISSERHFARDETQSPVILVRPCFPWAKLQHSDESHEATQNLEGYSKPAVWKRILRKLRAEARKIQVARCEGLCLPRENPDYNSFSYNKNFDDGRQYWQQQSSTAPLPSAAPQFQKPWSSSSSYVSELRVQVDPLWQRRTLVSPSKLRVKKVSFADV